MPVEIGTHRNGDKFARVYISERGITATIEGTGPNDDVSTAMLLDNLRRLSEMASDAADAMNDGEQED